jgi:hypothetical protein
MVEPSPEALGRCWSVGECGPHASPTACDAHSLRSLRFSSLARVAAAGLRHSRQREPAGLTSSHAPVERLVGRSVPRTGSARAPPRAVPEARAAEGPRSPGASAGRCGDASAPLEPPRASLEPKQYPGGIEGEANSGGAKLPRANGGFAAVSVGRACSTGSREREGFGAHSPLIRQITRLSRKQQVKQDITCVTSYSSRKSGSVRFSARSLSRCDRKSSSSMSCSSRSLRSRTEMLPASSSLSPTIIMYGSRSS